MSKWLTWRKFNALRIIVYIVLTPIAFYLGWLASVSFVSLLSIWALVESAVAAWRADVPNSPPEPAVDHKVHEQSETSEQNQPLH